MDDETLIGKTKNFHLTKEFCDAEAKAFLEWMNLPQSVFIKDFCVSRGYPEKYLEKFAKKSDRWVAILNMCYEWEESRLFTLAFWNKANPGMSLRALNRRHDWIEKKAAEKVEVSLLDDIMDKSRDAVSDKS